MVGSTMLMNGQSATSSVTDTNRLGKLEKENQELQRRLDTLEALAQKEGLLPSGKKADPPISAMSELTLSGFVTTSYFHDSSDPPGHISPGYLWNRHTDSFDLNKIKVTLASPPVENNGEKFDAGFRVSLNAGNDAPLVNTGSGTTGFDLVREAFIELNIPIGTGLDVRAGELISLLNYESGDGGAVNANFSQGWQWYLTGNPPDAGVQLSYNFTDWLKATFRIQNGLYAGPNAFGSGQTMLGAIGLKPMKDLWFSLIAFGGREQAPFVQSLWGASLLGGWQATEKLGFGTELDYFNFHNAAGLTGDAPVWSTGFWGTYDFCKKIGVAVRAEYLSDTDGADAAHLGVGAGPGFAQFLNPVGTGQDLTSVALTLNYKPIPSIKIQPEIRWDHTSWAGGFVPGKQNRIIYGAGVSYLF